MIQAGGNDRQSKGTETAIQSAIPVSFDAFFPRGAFVVGEVEPIVKWSDDGERQGQDLDKNSGHPLWQVRVIDADPDAKKGQGEVTVKIASISQDREHLRVAAAA